MRKLIKYILIKTVKACFILLEQFELLTMSYFFYCNIPDIDIHLKKNYMCYNKSFASYLNETISNLINIVLYKN